MQNPQPPSFHDDREKSYWHSAQDIAFRVGCRIDIEGLSAYLVSDGGRELLCQPTRPKKFWYETWLELKKRYPSLDRPWTQYRP